MDLRCRMEAHKSLIKDRLDPDFELFDELLACGSHKKQKIDNVMAIQNTYGRSEKLLEYVFARNLTEQFLDALRETQQTHLANFILSNGERPSDVGDDWPLTEREISILDRNGRSFIDLLDTRDLLHRLYSHNVINRRHMDTVSSKSSVLYKNDALLGIVRRTSLQNYKITIDCLRLSKQYHLANVLADGGGFTGAGEMDFRVILVTHKVLIRDRLDPDFGLLDELLSSESLTREDIANVKALRTTFGRSDKVLEYVFEKNIYEQFLDALRDTQQTHLVNFILSNGERSSEFGDDWPLTKREISILNTNQRSLIDLLETNDLLHGLYSHTVINNRQKDFVSSKSASHEKNDALLEILRKTSLQNYNKTIYCLNLSKQSHIAKVLKDGGVVIRVHSELETESDVNEVEDELITKITDLFGDRSLGDSARILECTQLRLIAAKKGNSIILYFFCKTSTEFVHLQEMQTLGKLANVVKEMFNEMLSRAIVITVRTIVSDEDLLKKNSQFVNCAIYVGSDDSGTCMNPVIKINLDLSNEISTREQVPTVMRMESFAAVYNNTMYVTGIGENYDEIWKYEEMSGWKKCASLVQGRRSHSAAFIDEVLYICGGFDNSNKTTLDSVEAYNAIHDKCVEVGKLVHCVESTGNCVPLKSSLYIFGGLDKDYKAMKDVQVYNTNLNTCTLLTKPMPRPYAHMRALLWRTYIILVGRYTCFVYNILTELWEERKEFKTNAIHFGVVLEDEDLFVIGGMGRDDVRYVPILDIVFYKVVEWKILARLPQSSAVCAYGKMSFSA